MNSAVAFALIFAGLMVYYFKRIADKAKKDAILAETRGQDKILKENQDSVKNEINEIDKRIDEFYKEREKLQIAKTKQERAKDWNK